MSRPSDSKATPRLRLATSNGEPVQEKWSDIPGHALVTITMPRGDVDGIWYGYGNMMHAFGHMMAAMKAAKAGKEATVQKELDRAMGSLAVTSSFAADVYQRAQDRARRKNRRRGEEA